MSNQLRVAVVNDRVILPDTGYAAFAGIDTQNVLASNATSYTATGDCIAVMYGEPKSGESPQYMTVNGTAVAGLSNDNGSRIRGYIQVPVKAGQVLGRNQFGFITVYGRKY